MTELFLDVRKFKIEEFALGYIENRTADFKDRIGNYQGFKVGVLGIPDFPFKQIRETDKREIDALFLAQKMARDGYNNFIWISAPGGEYKHPECRLTLLRVANVTPDNVYFDNNRAICGNISSERCLDLAKCLVVDGGVMLGEPKNAEELRGYIIGFKDDQIIERLATTLVEMEDVWEAMQKGEDKNNLKKMIGVAEWVERRFGGQMKNVVGEREAIRLGAMIEARIQQTFGIRLMAGGVHGMSNSAALSQLWGSPFDVVFGMSNFINRESLDPRLDVCENCRNCFIRKKKKCPKCHPND